MSHLLLKLSSSIVAIALHVFFKDSNLPLVKLARRWSNFQMKNVRYISVMSSLETQYGNIDLIAIFMQNSYFKNFSKRFYPLEQVKYKVATILNCLFIFTAPT